MSPSDAGFAEDLALVVAETGHARFAELTDPAHDAYDARYVAFVRSEAARLRGEPALPSAATMAKNLASAAFAAARDGFARAPVELANARLEVCRSCEWFRPRDRRCAKCGCGTSAKASLRSSRCPLDRWPDPGAMSPGGDTTPPDGPHDPHDPPHDGP